MSSGMSSRPSVGVGLKLNIVCYNSPQNIFVRQKYLYLVVEMSRHLAGPGGGSAYCGEVGGLARADIRMEHCNTLSVTRRDTRGHTYNIDIDTRYTPSLQ